MFTNKNILKEKKKKKNGMFLWIGFAIAAIILFGWGLMDEKESKNVKSIHLNEIIASESSNKAEKDAYLEIQSIPYLFAQYDSYSPKYYIVSDGTYLYIAYMNDNQFDELNHEEIHENHATITGITKETTTDVRKLAIDAYNQGRDENEKLVLADFENYFGNVYLDMTIYNEDAINVFYVIGGMLLFIAGICFLVWIIQYSKFKKKMKNIPADVIKKLDDEMNDENAFYYEKAHLYLTEHFIINFANTFNFIHYDDIIWLFPREFRNRGVKTAQSICIMTKEGKTYVVANVDAYTKASKAQFEEIYKTIASKNANIITGYSKEARKLIKEKYNFKA